MYVIYSFSIPGTNMLIADMKKKSGELDLQCMHGTERQAENS